MKKVTLFFIGIVFCLTLIGQEQYGQMDANGYSIQSSNIQDYTQILNQLKGANPWTSIGPFGGDVMDMAVSPLDANVVIAAAGIPYKSDDGGESWTYIESLLSLATSGVEVVESSPNGTIYAAGLYAYYKIFRSFDGGETWEQKSIPVNGYGLDIAIDPNDSDVIYMGLSSVLGGSNNNVIVKSDDGGDTWTYFNLTSVLPVGWSVVNLVVDPDDSQVIFAIGNEGLSNAAVVATFDGGLTWENKTGNLPTGKPYNSLTIADQNVYIAGGQLFGGQIMGIYKTENYGQSWSNISGSFPNKVSNAILIDPDDTDKMYVATEGDGVYSTDDGGAVWNYNSSGAGDNGAARCLVFEPENTDVLYAGFLSLAVCKSIDASLSWEFKNKGIATLQTDDIEVNPNDPLNTLVGFEAENSGGCYLSNDGGDTWQLVEGLPGTRFSQVTFGADEAMYAWSNGPSSIAQEGLYKSTDGGNSWVNKGPNIGGVFETEIFGLVASKTDPNLIFIGGNNFGANGWESMIYRSVDGGENWENVYKGPEMNSFKFISIDPNSIDQTIYAGYANQNDHAGFLRSTDGGTTWSDFNSGIPATNKWGGAIVNDPLNSDIIYGGVGGFGNLNGSIYKSVDAGGTWTQTSLSIGTYSKISDIVISPLNSDVVYAATSQNGVYVSFDAGDNWEAANDGLPASYVTGFSNAFLTDDLWYFYASTFSNSAFKTEVAEPGTTRVEHNELEGQGVSVYPNPSNGTIFIELSDQHTIIESITIYNMQGQLVKHLNGEKFTSGITQLELELYPNVYLVKVFANGKVTSKKLVID